MLMKFRIQFVLALATAAATQFPSFAKAAEGPSLSTVEAHLAQDSFPTLGFIDYQHPAANSVRFDMAQNIAAPMQMTNLPGDSLVVDIVTTRPGALLSELPKMFYRLEPNSAFDSARTLPNLGFVYGDSCRTSDGTAIPDQFFFDLDDEGLLFPGDIIHYYFSATSDIGGFDEITTTLPAELTDFDVFGASSTYDRRFEMRALPSLSSFSTGHQPHILFIADAGDDALENAWETSLANLGFLRGINYDKYRVQDPASGLGNGIGGRATAEQIAYYETILYSCGWQLEHTLSEGDYQTDPSDDLNLLEMWYWYLDKNLLVTGNALINDLLSHPQGAAFCANRMGVNTSDEELGYLLGQDSVLSCSGPSYGVLWDEWSVPLGSYPFHTRELLLETGTDTLAVYLDKRPREAVPTTHVAASERMDEFDNRTIVLPYDLGYIQPTSTKVPAPNVLRTHVLELILTEFGVVSGTFPTGVVDLSLSTATTAAPEPALLYVSLGGSGSRLDQAYALGGNIVDATITVILRDGAGEPIANYPANDIWLTTAGGAFNECTGETIADHDTDENGMTTFSGSLCGGGASLSPSDGLIVMIGDEPLQQPPLPIQVRSTDLTNEGIVNLSDVVVLAYDYFYDVYGLPEPSTYYSDFYWDGKLNLSDVMLFARTYFSACSPPRHAPLPLPETCPLPPITLSVYFDEAGTQSSVSAAVGDTVFARIFATAESSCEIYGAALGLLIHAGTASAVSDSLNDFPYSPVLGDTLEIYATSFSHGLALPAGTPVSLGRTAWIAINTTDPDTVRIVNEFHHATPVVANCAGQLSSDITVVPGVIIPYAVSVDGNPRPRTLQIWPCYPNPFNPSTIIRFDLPWQSPVYLEVYDAAGRRVRVLEAGKLLGPGRHEVAWDGKNDRNLAVASGVYFCRLRASGEEKTIRMTLLK